MPSSASPCSAAAVIATQPPMLCPMTTGRSVMPACSATATISRAQVEVRVALAASAVTVAGQVERDDGALAQQRRDVVPPVRVGGTAVHQHDARAAARTPTGVVDRAAVDHDLVVLPRCLEGTSEPLGHVHAGIVGAAPSDSAVGPSRRYPDPTHGAPAARHSSRAQGSRSRSQMFEQAFVARDIVWGSATGRTGCFTRALRKPALGRTNRTSSKRQCPRGRDDRRVARRSQRARGRHRNRNWNRDHRHGEPAPARGRDADGRARLRVRRPVRLHRLHGDQGRARGDRCAQRVPQPDPRHRRRAAACGSHRGWATAPC